MISTPASAYAPGEAAKHLGIAEQTLRRWAKLYEVTFGDLPTDRRGRVYPLEALERMSAARDLLEKGGAITLERAFAVLAGGGDGALAVPDDSTQEALAVLGRIEGRLTLLEAEVATRLEGLEVALTEHAKRVEAALATKEEADRVDLQRRLDYALGELRRRDEIAQGKRRSPWWRFGRGAL